MRARDEADPRRVHERTDCMPPSAFCPRPSLGCQRLAHPGEHVVVRREPAGALLRDDVAAHAARVCRRPAGSQDPHQREATHAAGGAAGAGAGAAGAGAGDIFAATGATSLFAIDIAIFNFERISLLAWAIFSRLTVSLGPNQRQVSFIVGSLEIIMVDCTSVQVEVCAA